MTKKRFYFKLITSVVVTALLCHDISWAGGVRQSKLSPGSIFASAGAGKRLRIETLDTFLRDPKTCTNIFRYNRLPRPPKELAKDLDGFFEVTGRAAIEGDIARITVKLDGKPAVLCFSKEPLTDSRRYWFESVSISRITGELKRFYNTHRSIPYGTGLDAREKGVFLPADIDDLVSIFTALDIPAGLRFIDLGSGDGRVTAMAGAYNLLATGIEYEKDLFRLGLDMKRRILSRYISKDRVRFINSNFMDEDLSQYDVMFYSAARTYEVADLEEKIMRELRDDAVLVLYGYGDSYKDWLTGWSRFKIDNTMVFARRDNNPLFMRLKENAKKTPGGRWPWLRDLLARYGLPGWLQVPIEQAFIGLGYVLYFTGSPILASFILPVFIGLHYVWRKARAPSIRDILIVSLMNLIGFALATPILAPIMFILSSIAHYIYNTLVIRYAMPQEGRAVFKEGGGYSTLSGQTIKDLLIFEPGIGLFDFVNETITKWGKDRLRWLLTHPYLDEKEILARQEIVCCLMNNPAILMEIRRILAIFSQKQDINGTIIMIRKHIESLPRDNIYSQYFRTVTEEFMQRPWDKTIVCKVMGLIGELDAFSSLAQSGLRYASSEQGHITMPRILEQAEPLFQMKQGIIPGNLRRRQVPNDIELSSEKRFALITGPNISGKTMLLRTIGRMAILSQIGSLVPAEDMAITPMRIHSLISINDDPQTGRSYTEVEADELSGILDSTDKGCKQIYLIDEMLRGMYRNARDTVEPDAVKILASSGALTVLTTHNNPLTELAEEDKNIANYHFTDTDNKEYRYRLMHGRSTINNAIKIIESLSWLRVLIPYKERWKKHFERHAETPSVVHVENENIKGKQINIFNKNAVLVWKGLIDSLKDKLNSLKEKIEREREISGWDIMGFISFFIGSILGTIIEDPGKIKSKFFDALMLTLLFFIIAPLLIRLYLILEKILSIRPKKKLLEKILQKQEHNINAKPQMQQVLEGYLEKTAARSNDTDLYGRVLDTYAYSLGESTTRSLGVIGGERNLLAVIDNTRTVWGRERLRWLLTHPYHNTERIRNRQQIVKIFNEKKVIREELIRYLEEIRASWERNIVSQTPPGHFLKIHTNERRILLYVNDILEAAEGLKKILEELDIDGNTEIAELLKDLGLINYELAELKVGKGPISRLMFLLNFDDSRLWTIKDMLLGKDTNGLQYRLRYVLSAIGEVDAYLSLAELPDRFTHWATMPEIAKAGRGVPVLDIKDGYCPTIPIETSQPNTVLLNSENRILVIGGAHGAGKSTFLRTINQLEILGSIGSFVPARAMVFTPIEILSCMNLQDAPDRGLSYFGMVADILNRLYGSSLSRDDYYIASIDEFLEGTNTTEAREIAEAVIKWLSENNIPAVIVSQDTEVLKIVAAKKIPNVNIAHPERVVVSGKRFVYKIVPGLPDEIAICKELLKRPLNRHLREAILKVMQGKAELEDLPDARGIEIDADTRAGTSV